MEEKIYTIDMFSGSPEFKNFNQGYVCDYKDTILENCYRYFNFCTGKITNKKLYSHLAVSISFTYKIINCSIEKNQFITLNYGERNEITTPIEEFVKYIRCYLKPKMKDAKKIVFVVPDSTPKDERQTYFDVLTAGFDAEKDKIKIELLDSSTAIINSLLNREANLSSFNGNQFFVHAYKHCTQITFAQISNGIVKTKIVETVPFGKKDFEKIIIEVILRKNIKHVQNKENKDKLKYICAFAYCMTSSNGEFTDLWLKANSENSEESIIIFGNAFTYKEIFDCIKEVYRTDNMYIALSNNEQAKNVFYSSIVRYFNTEISNFSLFDLDQSFKNDFFCSKWLDEFTFQARIEISLSTFNYYLDNISDKFIDTFGNINDKLCDLEIDLDNLGVNFQMFNSSCASFVYSILKKIAFDLFDNVKNVQYLNSFESTAQTKVVHYKPKNENVYSQNKIIVENFKTIADKAQLEYEINEQFGTFLYEFSQLALKTKNPKLEKIYNNINLLPLKFNSPLQFEKDNIEQNFTCILQDMNFKIQDCKDKLPYNMKFLLTINKVDENILKSSEPNEIIKIYYLHTFINTDYDKRKNNSEYINSITTNLKNNNWKECLKLIQDYNDIYYDKKLNDLAINILKRFRSLEDVSQFPHFNELKNLIEIHCDGKINFANIKIILNYMHYNCNRNIADLALKFNCDQSEKEEKSTDEFSDKEKSYSEKNQFTETNDKETKKSIMEMAKQASEKSKHQSKSETDDLKKPIEEKASYEIF